MSEPLTVQSYAAQLLQSLGMPVQLNGLPPAESAAAGWACSGLMALTGRADGPPLMCPAPLTVCADGALAALASLAPPGAFKELRGRELLAERAAIAGHQRAGAVSPGGSCRLLQAADGWFALNLAREDDWALLPALLETECAANWLALSAAVRLRSVSALLARARELGLAAADAGNALPPSGAWFAASMASGAEAIVRKPLVIDLSTLWAGPLCGHLLQLAGARVIKVESTQRPDGARAGPPEFYDLLNAGKQSLVLDLSGVRGRTQLRELLLHADIVIESSRPRALRQMGIHAEQILRDKPGLCWIGISGYGRDSAQENWIAYGDDAAVAAGLSQWMFDASGEWLICGDAIADPLTGLHAALAAWAAHKSGRGGLISLALSQVVRHCMQVAPTNSAAALRERVQRWTLEAQAAGIAAPHARRASAAARVLGADTPEILREFAL